MAIEDTSPDPYDLQETFMTDVRTEVIGSNVRIVIGVNRGGHTYWLRSAVCPAELLITISKQCFAAAQDALDQPCVDVRRKVH